MFNFNKNQVQLEIMETFKSIPIISVLTNFIFLFEIRGYSKLYDKIDDSKLGNIYH
jgi:lathosterol oxidase